MSAKDFVHDYGGYIVTFFTSTGAWFIGWWMAKPRKDAAAHKTYVEADAAMFDIRVREDNYDAEKYGKLLDRAQSSEKKIEELIRQLSEISSQLKKALTENQELISELNMYKTIL